MCLIVVKPQGVEVPLAHYENGAINNPDGWGVISVGPDGNLISRFGWKHEDLTVDGDMPERHKDVVSLFHSRWATHGGSPGYSGNPSYMAIKNRQPFFVNSGRVAMAHNGIISDLAAKAAVDGPSDSLLLAREVDRWDLASKKSLGNSEKDIVDKMLGSFNKRIRGSRVAFLFGGKQPPNRFLLAGGDWTTDRGAWYSNDGYKFAHDPYGGYCTGWPDYDYDDKDNPYGHWETVSTEDSHHQIWVPGANVIKREDGTRITLDELMKQAEAKYGRSLMSEESPVHDDAIDVPYQAVNDDDSFGATEAVETSDRTALTTEELFSKADNLLSNYRFTYTKDMHFGLEDMIEEAYMHPEAFAAIVWKVVSHADTFGAVSLAPYSGGK